MNKRVAELKTTPGKLTRKLLRTSRRAETHPFDGQTTVTASLTPLPNGEPIFLPFIQTPGQLLLGRGSNCDIVIADPMLSQTHCRIVVGANGLFTIVDMKSANGTWVNGVTLVRSVIKSGDVIQLGGMDYKFETGVDDRLRKPRSTAHPPGCAWTLARADSKGADERLRMQHSPGKRVWTVGRTAGSDLMIPVRTISAKHAAFRFDRNGQLEIQDRNSLNGTFVDGRRVGTEWSPLRAAAVIRFGDCDLKLERDRE